MMIIMTTAAPHALYTVDWMCHCFLQITAAEYMIATVNDIVVFCVDFCVDGSFAEFLFISAISFKISRQT